MTGGSARRAAAVVALFGVIAALPASADEPALDNEDIVRLVVNGTAEKAILDAIAARRVDFNLEAGVVEELRTAGISERIIAAMRRRQAVMPRAAPPPPTEPPVDLSPRGIAVIAFSGGDGDGEIFAIRALPQGVERPGGMEVGRATDLALAVLCTTSNHVPDHWDTRTPIEGGPRHEIVFFRAGSRPGKVRGFEVLLLNADLAQPVALALGSHDLIVGLAGQVAGSSFWRLLASDRARVEVAAGRTMRIKIAARSRLRGTRMAGFQVEQEWKASVAGAAEGP